MKGPHEAPGSLARRQLVGDLDQRPNAPMQLREQDRLRRVRHEAGEQLVCFGGATLADGVQECPRRAWNRLGNERSNIVLGYRLATPIQRELVELADRDHALAPPVDVALGDHGTDPGGELASRPGFEANRTLSGSILDPSRHRPTLRSLELACFAAGASDELAQGVQGGRGLR